MRIYNTVYDLIFMVEPCGSEGLDMCLGLVDLPTSGVPQLGRYRGCLYTSVGIYIFEYW